MSFVESDYKTLLVQSESESPQYLVCVSMSVINACHCVNMSVINACHCVDAHAIMSLHIVFKFLYLMAKYIAHLQC